MRRSSQFVARNVIRVAFVLGGLVGLAAPSLVVAAVIEGTSGSGTEDVSIRYRCESLDCEFEAVVYDRLRDDVVEYDWSLGDGRTATTDNPKLTHRWTEPGWQLVNVSVHDRYCDLFVAEASFLTSAPAVADADSLMPAAVRLGQDASRVVSEPLQGMEVQGDVFIFVESLRAATSVAFSLSGPGFGERALRVEEVAPFDLAGGGVDSANPFDTRNLEDGAYRLDVQASFESGLKETVSVDFQVFNDSAGQIAGTPSDGSVPDGSDAVSGDTDEPTTGAALPDEPASPVEGLVTEGSAAVPEDTNEPTVEAMPPTEPVPSADTGTLPRAAVLLGQNASRGASVPLDGAVIGGDAFVFVGALPDVSSVAFRLSGPAFDARTLRVEKFTPFDLAGGSVDAANPFDTRTLADGPYRLDVLASHRDGSTASVSVDFEVRNQTIDPIAEATSGDDSGEASELSTGAALPEAPDVSGSLDDTLVFSTQSSRADSEALVGATTEGRIYVHLEGALEASAVHFFLDDPTRSGKPLTVEKRAPWDAMGGSMMRARSLDTRDLSNGRHVLSAEIIDSGESVVLHGTFTVAN